MKNKIIALVLVLAILPMMSADVIMPGYKGIPIQNQITNIDDFPSYTFLAYGEPMCKVQLVNSEGFVQPDYKLCSLSVYALPKENFDAEQIEKMNDYRFNYTSQDIKDYLESIGAKEVIKEISTYTQVPVSSTQKSILNNYTIDVNQLQTAPNRTIIQRNSLVYWYIAIPLIVLIAIVAIIIRKWKN